MVHAPLHLQISSGMLNPSHIAKSLWFPFLLSAGGGGSSAKLLHNSTHLSPAKMLQDNIHPFKSTSYKLNFTCEFPSTNKLTYSKNQMWKVMEVKILPKTVHNLRQDISTFWTIIFSLSLESLPPFSISNVNANC